MREAIFQCSKGETVFTLGVFAVLVDKQVSEGDTYVRTRLIER